MTRWIFVAQLMRTPSGLAVRVRDVTDSLHITEALLYSISMLYELNSPELVTDFGRRLQLYVQKTLQLPVDLHKVPVPAGVPTFLSHDFAFFEGTIGSWPCAVVVNRFASRSVE